MESSVQLTEETRGIDTSDFTPAVGVRGVYSLREPFKTAITEAIHTCTAIRKLSSLVAAGEPVYETYYKPFGIREEDYDRDIALDKSLITLISDGGAIAHFPVGYLMSYPNMNGVVYQRYILQIGLPPFPADTNFGVLENSIKSVVQSHLGVPNVAIAVTENSELQLVPNDTHAAVSATRNSIAAIPTPLSRLHVLQQQFDALVAERDQLLALFEQTNP